MKGELEQVVAIGSKGEGTVAKGPKAKKGTDKVKALRNQFDAYAARFFNTTLDIADREVTRLHALHDAAIATNNNAEAIAALQESWKVQALACGIPELAARVYASEAVRITKACYVSVKAVTDKEGKVTYRKLKDGERGTPGSKLLEGMGYNKAKAAASAILKAAGVASKRGRKTSSQREQEKVWSKVECIDAIDTMVRHIRALPVDAQALTLLLKVRDIIKGTPKKVMQTAGVLVSADHAKAPSLTDKHGKPVVKGSPAWQAMSRGQKAAATRRLHEQKKQRVVERNVTVH